MGIKPVALHQAGCQAQRHGRIVGPLPRLEMERTSADHIRQRRETSVGTELNGRANRIPDGKAKKTTTKTVLLSIGVLLEYSQTG